MISIFPEYSTELFCDIYSEVNDFIYDYNNVAIPKTISVDNAVVLYYLLYAKFGNSPIANYDVNQFKYKLFSTIWQYGPTWEKRLDIQDTIRDLTSDDLIVGAKAIYNHANNPSVEPSTDSKQILPYINDQSVTHHEKSKMDAYTQLWGLLATDVTNDFLNRFTGLFNPFVRPVKHVIYVSDAIEEEE